MKAIHFVLNPKSGYAGDVYAAASRVAMEAYAQKISKEDPRLSDNLLHWVINEVWNEYELSQNEKYLD